MTCSSCKFQFCWLCLDDWVKTHTDHFKCNKYKQGDKGETKNEGADQARIELEKYNFYYTRYNTHRQSQKFETKLREEAEMKIQQFLKNSNNVNDMDIISIATEILIECRRSLKYTYIFGYFLSGEKAKKII